MRKNIRQIPVEVYPTIYLVSTSKFSRSSKQGKPKEAATAKRRLRKGEYTSSGVLDGILEQKRDTGGKRVKSAYMGGKLIVTYQPGSLAVTDVPWCVRRQE